MTSLTKSYRLDRRTYLCALILDAARWHPLATQTPVSGPIPPQPVR